MAGHLDGKGMTISRSVVLLSGGMDSATVLALASQAGEECYALSFDYGQKHNAELSAARAIATQLKAKEHRIINIDMAQLGGSALTDASIDVPEAGGEGIPVTYVPARNTVFLSLGLAWAEVLEADAIYVGVNAVDYSGYPDCRPEYISAFQAMANLATKRTTEGRGLEIRTPLIAMSKADIVRTGQELGVDFAQTVSCYSADKSGAACGHCDACELRRQGFAAAGLADPTRYS
jgi:7-cyano-7-deazaguanine synthase